MNLCACGRLAVRTLRFRYRFPRAEALPQAMDPYYVHGGGYSVQVCGNQFCDRGAVVSCREQIIDDHVLTSRPWLPSGLSAEQMDGLELEAAS